MTNTKETTMDQPETFPEFLATERDGELAEELTLALATIVEAVAKHGKKGMLTLKLAVTPAGMAVDIVDEIALKVPDADRTDTWYVGRAGQLSRRNPNQQMLPLEQDLDAMMRSNR